MSKTSKSMYFVSPEGKYFRTQIGFNTFIKEATKRGSSIARIPIMSYCTCVLFKDTQENLIAPELMYDVCIPYKWKECLFHQRCSYDVQSILRSGLLVGGRESKERRQTIFFTSLNPFGDNPDTAEPCDDLFEPRKVH